MNATTALRRKIEAMILEERNLQDAKFGDNQQDWNVWYLALVEEIGEVAKAMLEAENTPTRSIVDETVQVAAVALFWHESIRKYKDLPYRESESLLRGVLNADSPTRMYPIQNLEALLYETAMLPRRGENYGHASNSILTTLDEIICQAYKLIRKILPALESTEKGGQPS